MAYPAAAAAAIVAMADADQPKNLAFYIGKIRQRDAASWEKVQQQHTADARPKQLQQQCSPASASSAELMVAMLFAVAG